MVARFINIDRQTTLLLPPDRRLRLCLESKIRGGRVFTPTGPAGFALCLESKIRGGRVRRFFASWIGTLCLESKIRGGRVGLGRVFG